MKYLFKTQISMKPYNIEKWWISNNIIKDLTIEAENIEEALQVYQKIANEKYYFKISQNALKNKSPMFIDIDENAKQIGYVITASTLFEDTEKRKWVSQYVDLWIEIITLIDTDFKG